MINCRKLVELKRLLSQNTGQNKTVVLFYLFPSQNQQTIVGTNQGLQSGNQIDLWKITFTSKGPQVYMMASKYINVQTRTHNYENWEKKTKSKEVVTSKTTLFP